MAVKTGKGEAVTSTTATMPSISDRSLRELVQVARLLSDETRLRIINAAREILSSREGSAKFSVEAVARQAGVARMKRGAGPYLGRENLAQRFALFQRLLHQRIVAQGRTGHQRCPLPCPQ